MSSRRQAVFRKPAKGIFVTPETSWKISDAVAERSVEEASDRALLIRKAVENMETNSMSSTDPPSNVEIIERSQQYLSELALSMKEPIEASREFFLTEALPLVSAIKLGTLDGVEVVRLSTEEQPDSALYESTLSRLVQEALVLKQAVFVADTLHLNREARFLFMSRFLPEKVDASMAEQLKAILSDPPTAQFDRRSKPSKRKVQNDKPSD